MSLEWTSNDLRKVPKGRRKRGKHKLRWEDGVDNDVKAVAKRNWENLFRNRQIWKNLPMKAAAQEGLLVSRIYPFFICPARFAKCKIVS
jgi:hypothetical protein